MAIRTGTLHVDPAAFNPPEARGLRRRLVDELAAAGDVRDQRVRQVLLSVPRHLFVPRAESLEAAYANDPSPIGFDQTISQPTIVAIMTEALELAGAERVLEIGTGSGYQTAILSALAREVFSIEVIAELALDACTRLARLGYHNVHVRLGDGYLGWPEEGPFDRILLTAAPRELPPAVVEQLAEGGVLVAPVGSVIGPQTLLRLRKREGGLTLEDLGPVRFVPMDRKA